MNVISTVGAKIFTVHFNCFSVFLGGGQFSTTGYVTGQTNKQKNTAAVIPIPLHVELLSLIGILKYPVIYWQKGEISDESHFFSITFFYWLD